MRGQSVDMPALNFSSFFGSLVKVMGLCVCVGLGLSSLQAEEFSPWAQERAEILKELQENIEPNLPERDVRRLKTNVKRLGSFRREWVTEAQKFLVENASLAELYIYNYSRVRNPRLNTRLIESLLRFESYKYPEAIWYFSEDLMVNEKGASALVPLLKKSLAQTPEVWIRVSPWLLNEGAQHFALEEHLVLARQACVMGAQIDFDQKQRLEAWASSSKSLWGQILAADLKACLDRI